MPNYSKKLVHWGGSNEFDFESGGTENLKSGSILIMDEVTQQHSGIMRVALTGGTDTAAGIASIANPCGVALWIDEFLLVESHIATGACTLDIGQGSSASTLYDTLIDGIDVHSTAAPAGWTNYSAPGTNGLTGIYWPSANFITISTASGASAGFTGIAIIQYIFAN
jgi:hypothetical protein